MRDAVCVEVDARKQGMPPASVRGACASGGWLAGPVNAPAPAAGARTLTAVEVKFSEAISSRPRVCVGVRSGSSAA